MARQQSLLDPATIGEPDHGRGRQDGPSRREPAVPENMTDQGQEEDSWLDLLLPDKLPAEIDLDQAEGGRMHALLSRLLDALELDHPARLERIEDLLHDVPRPGASPAEIAIAGLPLTAFQATDYDRYFRVNRLSASEPALGMVRSLLQTVHAVTRLFCRSKDLSETRVRQQIEGFVTHTHLLARTFGLEKLR